MTRQNNKSSQIKDTLLSPVLPLSVSLVSPPPFLGTCVAPTPLGWLEQVPLALTLSEVFLFAFGLVCVCVRVCVYSKSTSASTHPLLPHIPADTDGHCYHVQQMSQLIDKLLSRGIHFSLTSTAAACGWGLSQRYPSILSHRVNQSSLPHLISPSLRRSLSAPSLCRSPLFTSNPPVSVSVPVARRWLLPSSVSLCHTLAAPTVSLPLLLSPTISCSLSLFLPPLLAIFHSLASLFSTPLPILGKSLWETNFSVCRSHKERDYGLICWLRALSASRQVAAPYSILIRSFFFFFFALTIFHDPKPVMYAW